MASCRTRAMVAGLALLGALALGLASCGIGSAGWRLVHNDAGELYEVARTDGDIELAIDCYDTRVHYTGTVRLVDVETHAREAPVHIGYWVCSGYSCNMRNGTLDDLVGAVDRHRFTYFFENNSEVELSYDFRALRPLLEEVRNSCLSR